MTTLLVKYSVIGRPGMRAARVEFKGRVITEESIGAMARKIEQGEDKDTVIVHEWEEGKSV